MIKPSMDLCIAVTQETESTLGSPLYRCITGVYNALEILSVNPKYSLVQISEDPFSFCDGEAESYREACYTNMLPALMRIKNNNVLEISKII